MSRSVNVEWLPFVKDYGQKAKAESNKTKKSFARKNLTSVPFEHELFPVALKESQCVSFSFFDNHRFPFCFFEKGRILRVNREHLLWIDAFNHLHEFLFVHVPRGVELVKLDFEVVKPVVHYPVFYVFFAERLTHAVNEVASLVWLDVYELPELVEIQIHH